MTKGESPGNLLKDHPLAAAVLATAALASALALLLGYVQQGVRGVADALDTSDRWPNTEYERVRSLSIGVNRDRFDQWLGAPVRTRNFEDGLREDNYVRPGYWVQVLSQDGLVIQWGLTSCSDDFAPLVIKPERRADDALDGPDVSARSVATFGSREVTGYMNVPMSNPPSYLEFFGGPSEAENRTEVAWGVNHSCDSGNVLSHITGDPISWECLDVAAADTCTNDVTGDPLQVSQGTLDEWRESLQLNTWAECAKQCSFYPDPSHEDLPFQPPP